MKKEKKRKNKEEEAAVAATLEPSAEKKVSCNRDCELIGLEEKE